MGDPDWTREISIYIDTKCDPDHPKKHRWTTKIPFATSAHFRPSAAWCFHGASGQFAADAGGPPAWLGQREIWFREKLVDKKVIGGLSGETML